MSMTEQVQYDRLYTTRELADAVGLSVANVARKCQLGELKASRTETGDWRILGSAWMNWFIQHMPCRQCPEQWMTPSQAARYCDVAARTIQRWVSDGLVPDRDDGSPGVTRFGPRVTLVHGSALRKVVSFRGPRRER